ncbi:14-3-3 protein domain-containing protein [Ditylenchus destructor]|uniref:14-3-3 protein domain-containing protein n=1 Tax=Ditylenchus destructor TaxID=166010 RepID=A0AAD4MU89_9BILA|nr:14-3-3 protein domain-containing protein [Ditylenchus destructor]
MQLAKVCQEAERFDDMAHAMRKVVKLCTAQAKDLSNDERSLLVSAYKHLLDAHLTSWRALSNAEKRESKENLAEPKHEQNAELVKERRKVENELLGICEQLIRLINNFLIPNASDKESVDFYRKIKEDCYGYLLQTGAPKDIEAMMEPDPITHADHRFRLVPLN